MRYNFEWDPDKAKENKRKHKISFERASHIFLDPFQLSSFDEDHSFDEERWITMGKNSYEVLLVVVHTFEEKERMKPIFGLSQHEKQERKRLNTIRNFNCEERVRFL